MSPWRRVAIVVGFMAARAGGALSADFDHSAWDQILRQHVDPSGMVAYKLLNQESRAKLTGYLQRVATADLKGMSRPEQLAFYINAYNAYVFQRILEGSTGESTFSRIKFFGFGSNRVAGADYSLKQLEDNVIRAEFNDPRIHFALVCAARSCPPLEPKAYAGATLDADLDRKGRQFLADTTRNPLGVDPQRVQVSKIFDWFADDFVKSAGSVESFLARYAPETAPRCLKAGKCRFEYVDYDWTMNAQAGQRP